MDKQNVVNNKCRTCLNKVKGLQSLHKVAIERETGEISYAELLKEVADINVNEDENNEMPQYICGCCCRKLRTSHAFIRQAQEANEKLVALLCKDETAAASQNIDCLQESQIDIQTCLEIKIESDRDDVDTVINKPPMEQCESQLKTEDTEESPIDEEKIVLGVKLYQDIEINLATPENDLDSQSSKNYDDDYLQSDSDCEEFKKHDDNLSSTPTKKRPRKRKKTLEMDYENEAKDSLIAVPCHQCNKIFKNSTVLSRHLRNTHIPDEQKCACPVCGVKFTRACNMFKHMRTQHDPDAVKSLLPITEKMHQCDKCPQKYTKKKHLNNHMKAKHSNDTETGDKSVDDAKAKAEERSLCSFCGSSFSKKAYLIVHMRRHTGERPFKCDLCERAFAHNSELKCHRRIHTGEKPYKCKLCEKAFRVYKKLATHMRSHTDERPYKCTQCERSFKYSKDLNIHTRIHTGERPYCCSVCGSTFTQSNSLKAHRMKLGHMEEATQPPSPSQLMRLIT